MLDSASLYKILPQRALYEKEKPVRTQLRPWIAVIVGVIGVALLLQGPAAVALSYNPEIDLPKPTGLEKSLTKLGRGLSNIMFGWAEIPVTFDTKLKEGKPLAYLLGVVPVLGTTRAIMRTSTGVFEAFTFPFSDQDLYTEAVLEHKYIF